MARLHPLLYELNLLCKIKRNESRFFNNWIRMRFRRLKSENLSWKLQFFARFLSPSHRGDCEATIQRYSIIISSWEPSLMQLRMVILKSSGYLQSGWWKSVNVGNEFMVTRDSQVVKLCGSGDSLLSNHENEVCSNISDSAILHLTSEVRTIRQTRDWKHPMIRNLWRVQLRHPRIPTK